MGVGEENGVEGAATRKIVELEVIGDDGPGGCFSERAAVAAVDEDVLLCGGLNPYCVALSDVDDVDAQGVCGRSHLRRGATLSFEDDDGGGLGLGGDFPAIATADVALGTKELIVVGLAIFVQDAIFLLARGDGNRPGRAVEAVSAFGNFNLHAPEAEVFIEEFTCFVGGAGLAVGEDDGFVTGAT